MIRNHKASAVLIACFGCSAATMQQAGVDTVAETPAFAAVREISIFSETLPSGYRVVIARTPPVAGRAPRIYVGSYVLHGSMQETQAGLAHLMEHVVANNRTTITGPRRPDSVNYFEGNALTRPFYTSFVSVLPAPLLASTVHSRMARAGRAENDSTVFATQVGRVLAELERDMNGQFPAYKSLVAITTGQSPRLSEELDLIRATKRDALAAIIDKIYKPKNAVIVVAGDLNIDSTRVIIHEADARLGLGELHAGLLAKEKSPTFRLNQSAVIEHQNRTKRYVVAVGWAKPALGDRDQFALLVADELLLGHGDSVEDPTRNQSSPAAIRLARSLGGSSFWDGRAGSWGAPDLVDTGPGLNAIVFSTDGDLTTSQVRDSVTNMLRDIRRSGMSDESINSVKESLASFYERWFFEPTYRILADHLMAYAVSGRDPNEVKLIPSRIRELKPAAVRSAFDRYFINAPLNVVILPPE